MSCFKLNNINFFKMKGGGVCVVSILYFEKQFFNKDVIFTQIDTYKWDNPYLSTIFYRDVIYLLLLYN